MYGPDFKIASSRYIHVCEARAASAIALLAEKGNNGDVPVRAPP